MTVWSARMKSEGKFFSTFACICVEKDGSPAPGCHGCYDWLTADLIWTLDDWVRANPTNWFGFSNIWCDTPDGWQRDSGYARCETAEQLLDFLILAGGDFSLTYFEPAGDEWRFTQRHLSRPLELTKCKVFYTIDRGG